MRVLLVNPTSPEELGTWQPLSLGYLAGTLGAERHEVKIFDRRIWSTTGRQDVLMIEACKRFKPELVGLTATTPLLLDAYHAAALLRESTPDALLVLGGPHATALPEQVLAECPALDCVAVGEGELTLSILASGATLTGTPGLVIRSPEGNRATGEPHRVEDLDNLPRPRRDLLAPEFYFRPHDQLIRGLRLRGAHIVTARGCTHRCNFCTGSLCFGRGIRYHSPERVVAEIQELVERYRIEGIYIADDVFMTQPERVEQLCQALHAAGLHRRMLWCCQLRVDGLTLEVLRLLKRAGCVQVEFGLESGSQRVLDRMNKRTTVEQNRQAVTLAHRVGLRVFANIVVGYPGETREDLEETRQMLLDTRPEAISLNRFVPLPGSPVFSELRSEGRLPTTWDAYTVGNRLNYTQMTLKEFEAVLAEMHHEIAEPTYLRSFYLWDLRRRPLHYVREVAGRLLRSPVKTLRRLVQILRGNRAQR